MHRHFPAGETNKDFSNFSYIHEKQKFRPDIQGRNNLNIFHFFQAVNSKLSPPERISLFA